MSGPLSPELRSRIEAAASRYPRREAVLLPALHFVQRERGFIGPEEERAVAEILGLRPVRVREVVTFYSMFRREPSGRHHLQVCTNVSCTLAGGRSLLGRLEARLGIKAGETTPDGRFSLSTVECLGACEQAPCLMADFDYHGGLDEAALERLLRELD